MKFAIIEGRQTRLITGNKITYLYNHLGRDSIALEAENDVWNLNAGYGWGKNVIIQAYIYGKPQGAQILSSGLVWFFCAIHLYYLLCRKARHINLKKIKLTKEETYKDSQREGKQRMEWLIQSLKRGRKLCTNVRKRHLIR